MKADQPTLYEIRVAGHLPQRWAVWFDGLALHNDPDGATTLRGPLADQAALFGLLDKIEALNLTLLSLIRMSSD